MKALLSRLWKKYICDEDPEDRRERRYWELRREMEAATALREAMQDSLKPKRDQND